MSDFQIPFTIPESMIIEITKRVKAELKKESGKPLTISQFADEVGESKSTIRRRVEAGVIVKIDRPGDIRISWAELERYRSGQGSK